MTAAPLTGPAGSGTIRALSPRSKGFALACLILGMAMAMLDVTIVNVALPTLRDSLDAPESVLSWVISGYSLAGGVVLISAGRLGDRVGHKWIFLSGVAIFTMTSLWCGLTQDGTWLVVARVVQGFGFGVFVPSVSAFIQILFSGPARGRAFAVMGATIGVFTAMGPLVGGLLIEAFGDADGWRWIFFVNLPFGLIAFIGAAILLPRGALGSRSAGLDLVGLLLVTLGLVAILVPLIEGTDAGWAPWTWILMVLGVLLLVAFGAWELRRERGDRAQLVPPRLFRHHAFTGGVVFGFVYFAAFTSIFFTLSIYWQAGLQHSALESGLMTLPFSIGAVVGAALSNRLSVALGRGVLVIGTALLSAGFLSLWLAAWLVPASDVTNWVLLGPLLVAGLGSGCVTAPNTNFIIATVDPTEAGAASGTLSTIQRVGAAGGIAVVGAVFFGLLDESSIAAAAQSSHGDPVAVAAVVGAAFHASAGGALLVSAIAALASFALVWTLPKRVAPPSAPAPRSSVDA